MREKHPLITGAFILTFTGISTRLIGFFYKIYLSGMIGAQGIGLYHMIFPIYGICHSLAISGIEITISKFVSQEISKKGEQHPLHILFIGTSFSFFIALFCSFFLYQNASFIATNILSESSCTSLLQVLSFACPLCVFPSCISGYYYGLQKTLVPALSQFFEQVIRVGSVYLICLLMTEKNLIITPIVAVIGLVFGELSAMLFSISSILKPGVSKKLLPSIKSFFSYAPQMLHMAIPATSSRILLTLLTCAEAILIPHTLRQYGLSSEMVFTIYGSLTGMAFAFILFPSVLTSSISILTLPVISKAQTLGDYKKITTTIQKSLLLLLPLGIFCMIFFIFTGNFLGTFFFHSELAGSFIVALAYICPVLYLNGTLNSILNGLGKTSTTFFHNIIATSIRLLFVLLLIPKIGIKGYMWGLLVNQLLLTFLHLKSLHKDFPIHHKI